MKRMKINLSNLALATKQQVFDQVVNHLLTQKEQSRKGVFEYCSYRGNYNKMCAAGCLIADEEYKSEMDTYSVDTSWGGLVLRNLVPKTQHDDFIRELQLIHDNDKPEHWEQSLKNLAAARDLSFNFIPASSETV